MTRLILALGLALLLAPSAEATRFYKWVDEDGVTHYSDSPPDHDRYERIDVREPRSQTLPDPAAEGEAGATIAPDAPPLSEAEARALNCENARETLAALLAAEVVQMDLNDDGRLEILSEAQRQLQIRRFRAEVAEHCVDA
jgi:hypothetical protein